MPKHYVGREFEALKLRYDDQVKLLQVLTEIDHRLMTAFFTLQLALGAWLATQKALAVVLQLGIAMIDLTIAVLFVKLLYNNFCRRQEVAKTVGRINDALGFSEEGVFLESGPLNPPYVRRYWFKWYFLAVLASTAGVFLVLLRPAEKIESAETTLARSRSDYEFQERCGKSAAAWFKARYGDGTESSKDSHTAFDFYNHYNSKLNKCFVLTVGTVILKDTLTTSRRLHDVNESKEYGEFMENRKNSWMTCNVLKAPCTSTPEWEKLIKPYMED